MLKMSQSYKCVQYMEHIEAASNLYGPDLNIPAKAPIFHPHRAPLLTNPRKAAPCNSRCRSGIREKKQTICPLGQSHTLYLLPNEIWNTAGEYLVASFPGSPFQILSHSFGDFLQSCETKSGTESLGTRLDI